MKNSYRDIDDRLMSFRTEYTRKCPCGHSITIYPTMKKDYIICNWCHKKVFKDEKKQEEQNKKVERENFRMKMWNSICEVK